MVEDAPLSPHRTRAKPEHGWSDSAIKEVTADARKIIGVLQGATSMPDLGAVIDLLTAIDRGGHDAIDLIEDACRYYCGTDW